MAILLLISDRDVHRLQQKIEAHLEDETEVWVYPGVLHPEKVEMAVLWKQPKGYLKQLPNLKLISSLGAGVEHIFSDPDLPEGVRITRIVDEALTVSMRNYVLMAILNIHKQFLAIRQFQQQRRWDKPVPVERPLRIGILGLGELGGDIAATLARLGFEVWGYSRRPRSIEGVHCMHEGEESLETFVQHINLLVCLLPLTPATKGILCYDLFRQMPKGSFFINVARGAHLVEEDLLKAMEEGQIREAWLDVFHHEPLPAEHPFWSQPGIVITPHIASLTNQDNAAAIIAGNYLRWKKGRPLQFEVDPRQQY